jgi:hypothetical protein
VRVIQRTNIAQVNLNVHPLHLIPAPDMSDPRNYMKALEIQTGRMYLISIYEGGCDEGDPWVVEFKPWQGALDRYPAKGISTKSLGEAAMKALAALYDAEHPADSQTTRVPE